MGACASVGARMYVPVFRGTTITFGTHEDVMPASLQWKANLGTIGEIKNGAGATIARVMRFRYSEEMAAAWTERGRYLMANVNSGTISSAYGPQILAVRAERSGAACMEVHQLISRSPRVAIRILNNNGEWESQVLPASYNIIQRILVRFRQAVPDLTYVEHAPLRLRIPK